MDIKQRALDCDRVSVFWLQIENIDCFGDVSVYTVEVLLKTQE